MIRLPFVRKRTGMLLLGMALLVGGCRKDLCYNHYREAVVDLAWESAWERDYGMGWAAAWSETLYGRPYEALLPGTAEGVTLIDYDRAGHTSEHFLSAQGGTFIPEEGEHDMLLYNNDTEYILFDDMASLPAARATTTTRTRGSFKALHAGERTVNPPDVLYGAYIERAPAVELHERSRIEATMRPLVYTYLVRYEFESGLEYVSLARGAMAGMAEEVYLRDGATSEKSVSILFDGELTSWGAVARVRSFGVPGFPDAYYRPQRDAEATKRHYALNLEVMLRNGRMKTYEFDITDQMARQPRGGVITVRGLTVAEDEIGTDSGFDVTVDDWGEFEDIDLPIRPA